MFTLTLAIIYTRWARYLVAAVALFAAAASGINAVARFDIQHSSGTVKALYVDTDAQTGVYKYNRLTLDETTTSYIFVRDQFTPALGEDIFQPGTRVDLWFTQSPLNDPDVVAVRRDDVGADPTMYVTGGYTHPQDRANGDLIQEGMFGGVGLLAIAAVVFLPASARRRARSKAGIDVNGAGYGATVVGQPQRQRPPMP